MPSVSLLIKSPIQVLTGPRWLELSHRMSTWQSFTRSWSQGMAILHKEVGILHKEVGILHKEVGILHKEVAILHKEVAILHKEMESFTRRWNP